MKAPRLVYALTVLFATGSALFASTNAIPSLEEALAARQDVWGLAAMEQTNGPSYEFFSGLLPPLRYVNAGFRDYPIVLGAVAGPQKARLISNGSAINARAGLNTWKEVGMPVTFRVDGSEVFGKDLRSLDGPHLERGFLPVVRFNYSHDSRVYEEQVFAAVEPALATHGIVFVRFGARGSGNCEVSATFEAAAPLHALHGAVMNTNSEVLAWFDDSWRWVPGENKLVASIGQNGKAALAIATKLMAGTVAESLSKGTQPLGSSASFDAEHRRCVNAWQNVVSQGMQLQVPEQRVNDAWRALIISLFTTASGNNLNYSAGNAYDRIYQAETGDAVIALMLWGHTGEAASMIPPLLDYTRDKLKYHNAGFKLQTLARYYWLTRDTNFLRSVRAKWAPDLESIISGREHDSGLFPREQYCGDIFKDVYSLHANGTAWRGLRDFAAVLRDIGEAAEAARLSTVAAEFRQAIMAATSKSERTDVQPTFIPVALFGEEKPYDPLTSSMSGSYWALIAPYMLGSGMFGPGSARERAIVDYLQERGGVCMGMIRFDQHSGLFANEAAIDDLYALRYTMKLLELDEVDRALVSFYGKLAQGLTRDTFVGAEGTGLRPLDEFGRPMYLPPNTTAQAYFLWMLRYLLVQDWDLDDDGTPETLRLCFATPKRWLSDSNRIKLDYAPTAFGTVSLEIESRLKHGEVLATVELPARNPARQTMLRIRVPDGWHVVSAKTGSQILAVDKRGTADISSLRGRAVVLFQTVAD